jgi:serine/threonine protein kinase
MIRELGRGAMGAVWSAEDLRLGSHVAVKIMGTGLQPDALGRFRREAYALAALRSPNVVRILEYDEHHELPYIAMELLEGESLGRRLGAQTRLLPKETARIFTQVARAIERVHAAGIVHRDLTPSNIFLARTHNREIAKLLDFGIAKFDAEGSHGGAAVFTRAGIVLGTPPYMSPEQVETPGGVDFRADIWALGVIAFECLVGCRPFRDASFVDLLVSICSRPMPIPSRCADVPPGLDAWFARACAREPSDRFQSAEHAAAELRRVCDVPGRRITEQARVLPARSRTGASNAQAFSAPASTTVNVFRRR